MKYKSFTIKNYKGIKELTIDLDKDPKTNIVTLVGLNECGKTTILEAISIVNNNFSLKFNHRLIPKNRKHSFTGKIEIDAVLELTEEDNLQIKKYAHSIGFKDVQPITLFSRKMFYTFKNSIYLETDSGFEHKFTLKGLKKNNQFVKSYSGTTNEFSSIRNFITTHLIPPIIYYPNFLFNFPSRIYLEEHDEESREQKTYRTVFNDIVDSLKLNLNVGDHIISRLRNKLQGADEALESTLEKIGVQITRIVFSAWDQLFDSKGKEIRLSTGIDELNNLVYVEVKLKEGTEQFQIFERSLGFKWFFAFLLFTEFRKNRATEKGEILFLLDEPASYLHSTAQKKLLNTFEKLVSNCKMIYTTHSHHLINPKWLAGAYIIKNKAIDFDREFDYNAANTDVEAVLYKHFVVQHPEQKTYFQPILDAIEYQPGLLEEVPNIILTEGKNDYYTFKYINDVYFGNIMYDLNFYPGNGADRNYQIIATYLSWGRDFLILLDGDKAGEDAKKRYIKEFGVVLQGKVITLKDIDSSYSFSTEKLFSEIELIRITQMFDPKANIFEKSKFNTALQNLYLQEQRVELSKVTIERFSKIFDFIK